MLRKRAKPSRGGSKQQHEIAFDHGHGHGGAGAVISAPKLFVASSGEDSPERQHEAVLTASATSPGGVACGGHSSGTAVPFSRRRIDCAGRGPDGDGRCKSHHPWDARPVGLGLVGALNDDGQDAPGDPALAAAAGAASVLTGQKLRVQTNCYAPCSPSSVEFGVKSGAVAGTTTSADHPVQHVSPRRRCMSPREMEMSEDYTRVITRGPNPRTTHIFDNRVIESSGGYFQADLWLPRAGKDDGDGFLRYCHGCSKDLGLGKDIFMYRGEKAFCSRECRYHEMLFDEGIEEL